MPSALAVPGECGLDDLHNHDRAPGDDDPLGGPPHPLDVMHVLDEARLAIAEQRMVMTQQELLIVLVHPVHVGQQLGEAHF